MNKGLILGFVCLVLAFGLAAAFDYPTYLECKQHDSNCGACLTNPKCGFCGSFGSGWCVPGNMTGSQLAPVAAECPAQYWKYDTCVEHIHDVSWNMTDTKIEWKLVTLIGTNMSDVTVEAVAFALSIENNEDAVLAIGHAKGDAEDLAFTFNGIAWDNFIEFDDANGDGMFDPYTEVARRIYNISSSGFLPIQYSNTSGPNNTVLHRGSIETMDGVYKLICHVSNSEYSPREGGKVFSPFEMKCDIELSNYEKLVPTDLLAINTFIVSAKASFNVSSNDTTAKKCQFGNGEAFFDWEDFVELDGGNETAPVKVSDLRLDDVRFPWDPETTVYTTIFSFVTQSGSFLWDPLLGTGAQAPPPPQPSDEGSGHHSNADSNSNNNGEVSAGSSLFACIKVIAFIVALTIPLFALL